MTIEQLVAPSEIATGTILGQMPTSLGHVTTGLWPVVLAAGAGKRLVTLTGGAPKQFWHPAGRPSLLESTLTRVAALGARRHTSIVVDAGHAEYVRTVNEEWREAQWLYQPRDRGTAPGVMLALTPVLELAPDQLVLLTPSDHGIVDSEMFRRSVLEAASAVIRRVADTVLFGIPPLSSCPDYGWIIPGALCAGQGRDLRRIIGFREKPTAAEVPDLVERRGLWSTMVLVARASTLQRLYARHLPGVAEVFAHYLKLPASSRPGFLSSVYATLPPSDFSRDVLSHASGLAVHVWPSSIGWADLGTPERLTEWMKYAKTRGAHNAA